MKKVKEGVDPSREKKRPERSNTPKAKESPPRESIYHHYLPTRKDNQKRTGIEKTNQEKKKRPHLYIVLTSKPST